MKELLKIILSLSLSGGLLILVLLFCRPLVRHKFSKRWQYYIWLVAVARLLLPFAPETNFMGAVFQRFDPVSVQIDAGSQPGQAATVSPETDFPTPQTDSSQPSEGGGAQLEPEDSPTPGALALVKQNMAVICLLVWLVVAIGLLIRKITVYQGFVKYIRAGQTAVSDLALWEKVGALMERHGIKGPVGLYTNSLISSPLLIGFFRPSIILPTTKLSETDFENTILHELTHYKRRDMFYKWLVQITICLHWFNPLVYLMGREVNRACELSCDEAVIRSRDEDGRRAYGDTLLNAMGSGGSYKSSLATVTLQEGVELIKERLGAIMRYQKKSKLIVSITIVATILICAMASTIGAYAVSSTAGNPTPWSSMGGAGQVYTYSQAGYYQGAYLFELGWNLNEKGYSAYADKAVLTLSDRTKISVSFDHACEKELQDKEMLADLKALIEKLKEQHANTANPLERPLVVSIAYVGNRDLTALAENYYENKELTKFTAIFPALSASLQKEYCNKMMEDEELSFFSSCAPKLDHDLIDYFAEKTYQQEKLTFFTNVVPYLNETQKQKWIARASQDQRNTFLAVLMRENSSLPPTPPTAQPASHVDVPFQSISITGNGPVGVELVRSQSPEVGFALLNMDSDRNCTTKAEIVDGVMQITVNNHAPNGLTVNLSPPYQNVVRVSIPDAEYTKFDIQAKEMVVKMQDFHAPVHAETSRAGFWLMDDTITQGTYDIKVSDGPIHIEASAILKDITANADRGKVSLRFLKAPENLYLDSTGCTSMVERPDGWPAIYKAGSGTPKVTLISSRGKAVIEVGEPVNGS